MKIIILGAGQVGSTVAEALVSEANDITVVDLDGEKLAALQDRLDLRTVQGMASHPSVLREAGGEDADMLLAVTLSDETNILACKLAALLFNTPTRIARVRSRDYLAQPDLFSKANLAVDYVISPEQEVTRYLHRLIEYPEALQVVDFAGGRVRLAAVKAHAGGLLVGHALRALREHMPQVDARVAAVFRKDRAIAPDGDTVIQAGDEVFFLAEPEHLRRVMQELRQVDQRRARRVMIAGGGNIGRRLAATLEAEYEVKLIDHNKHRAQDLAAELGRALVLAGNATDENLLEQENVGDMDVFCALTNDDEDNIMASLLAKRMGARKVIALINRATYVDLLQGGEIDIAISPAQATVSPLLSRIRRGDMAAVHYLRRGAAEAIEGVVHGDRKTSHLAGRRVEEVAWPEGVTVGAVIRGEQVIIAHHDTPIQAEDHLVLFVPHKRLVPKVERLFQVRFGFI